MYLLDGECKIRWAGSGVASEEERESLVKSVKTLIANKGKKPVQAPKGADVVKGAAKVVAPEA